MARNTIQIWEKIWNSSLQLSDLLRTKRLKTYSRPATHIAAKIAATPYTTLFRSQASILLKSARVSDLLEELLRPEFLRQLVLRHDGRLHQRRGVDLVHLHPELLDLRERLAFALRRHLAHHLGRIGRGLLQRRLLGWRELVPLGEREDEEGRIHQVPGERDAAGDFVELEGNGRRHRVLITVQHAALQRSVDLAEVHRRRVGAHRVDRGDEYLGGYGADLEALEVGRLLHFLLRRHDVAKAPAHRPRQHLEPRLLHVLVELPADRSVEHRERVLVAPPLERQPENAQAPHERRVLRGAAGGAGGAGAEAHRLDHLPRLAELARRKHAHVERARRLVRVVRELDR